MNEEARGYLEDLLKYLADVAEFTRDGRDEFLADRKTQFAVIHVYEVIGEIIKRLPKEFLGEQPQIDWRRVVRFRDFLAHNYEKIDPDIVWSAVEDLPNLRTAVEALLAGLDEEQDL